MVVAGGVPVSVIAVCAWVPMKGVILYSLTAPPVLGAFQLTVADAGPAVAVTPVTCPGGIAGAGSKSTSTK